MTADTAPGLVLYVAMDGDDNWSGRMPEPQNGDGPLATLQGARDEIRRIKDADGLPEGGVEVRVRQGTYTFDATLELTAEDSGTPEAPITYRAAPGEQVRLSGGHMVDNFTPVTDEAILNRLDEEVRGRVYQADLGALGITDLGEVTASGNRLELFFNDKPMRISRWPNEGFTHIVDVVEEDPVDVRGTKGDRSGKIIYEGDRPERWVEENDLWLHGYWFWDWSEQRMRVESIDTENKVIALAPPQHSYGYRKNQWYYAFNALCEVNEPGEWYLDRETGILYFYPPEPIDEGFAVVSITPTLMTMRDVSHVTVRGFILEAGRNHGLTISGGTGVRVVGCTLRNLGEWATRISGGSDHGVVGCDIYETGAGGIYLIGGDRTTLTPAGHFAVNNHIYEYARWNRVYQPGITLQGVGNRASHNLIHNAPHMGMGFGGNDHVIEFNEIHDVSYESNDAGAIYTGRNWTMRGHMIRHNYLHHITGFRDRGCVGVYLDDMFSSADIIGNVFYKVTRAAMVGGGRDCRIENNIFVDCTPAVHVDARALGWAHYHADRWLEEAEEKGTLSGIAFDKPPYSERYPALAAILENEPKAPEGNVIARNIFYGGRWDGIHGNARQYVTLEDNWVTDEDPGFVDAAATNFALREDSPVFERIPDFEPIPFDRIGLYVDEHRRALPPRKPTIVPASTAFVGELAVQIVPAAGAEDADMRYTLDGTDPDATSALYREPLRLTGDATLKVAAFREVEGHLARSSTTRETYTARHLGPDAGIYLSDLQPLEAHAHGGLKRDANYRGDGPVVLGGQEYERSVMICPAVTEEGGRSHALYALERGLENATRFKAVIGVDDAVGERGSVTFAVEVRRDGQWERIFDSDVFRGGRTPPTELDLDITGADQLRLLCTDAGDNIHADHAVWADAMLQ